MSEARSRVHAANTTAWKPMEFLALPSSADSFSRQDFRSQIEPGFRRAAVEAMPDNSLRAPAKWSPPAPAAATTLATGPSSAMPLLADAPQAAQVDEQQAEVIRTQAFEEGLAQGRREGEASAEARLRPQIEHARSQGLQDIRNLMIQVGEAVTSLRQQPETLYEPLKRLAVHIAEELVLGELQTNAQAIDRLVQRCVDELQATQDADVCVELNPRDLQTLQSQPDVGADRPSQWRWQAVDALLPGSVRVRVNDAVVTDLVEHRLQSLAHTLLGQPQRWAQQTSLRADRLAERFSAEQAVSDVQPRSPLGDVAPQRDAAAFAEEHPEAWSSSPDMDTSHDD